MSDPTVVRRVALGLTITAIALLVAMVLRVSGIWRYDAPETRIAPRPAPTTCVDTR